MPMNAAKPTVEQQEWMVRGSRTSKRRESSEGWTNWRKS
jgi:hypothetical protein